MSGSADEPFLVRLGRIDRRWIFLAMALSIIVPMLMKLRFPEIPQPMARATFDAIEAIPEGSRVLLAFDYDPASQGELQPMANAVVHHCASRGHKIVFMSLWPFGSPLAESTIERILLRYHPEYKYGVDYAQLGYQPGNEGVVKLMSTNLPKQFPNDRKGTPIAEVPLLAGLGSTADFKLIVSISAGYPGAKEWVQYANGPAPDAFTFVSGTTGVQAAQLLPYYPAQMEGMLLAVKGAAEYETIVEERYPPKVDPERLGDGRVRMGPQLVAHVLMVVLIVLGNLSMYASRSRGGVR